MIKARYFVLIALRCSLLFSADAEWALTTGGNWNATASWNPAQIPNAAGDFAKMLNMIIANSSVALGQTITIGQIQFDNANNYTITSNNFVFQTTAGNANINVTNANGNGAHTISSDMTLSSPLTVNQNSTSPFTLSGVISGAQTVTYSGPEIMVYGGAAANTYTALTTVTAGTLQLSKTAGAALAGNALITGGEIEATLANQLSSAAGITLTGLGTLDLGGLAQTLGVLNYQSGTLSGAGALTLASNTTALQVRDVIITDGLTLSGTGDIVFDPTNGGTASLQGALNFGGNTHTFNIPAGGGNPDMNVSGAISNGGVTKSGNGTLQFLQGVPNSYADPTTVTEGMLVLNGTATTIPGALNINAGTVWHSSGGQLAPISLVTVNGGWWNVNGQAESLSELDFLSGTVSLGGATLDLMSNSVALIMRDTTLSGGTVQLSGTGQVIFDATNGGTASIQTALDLGGNLHSFNIGDGGSPVDMDVSGVISNGSLTKIGPGTLQFSGTSSNTMTSTTVSEGTLSLNKTPGMNAVAGTVVINGGSLSLANTNQIDDGATIQITSGDFTMNGFPETIGLLDFRGGNVFQGGATLSLSGVPALSMWDTTLNGPIAITNGGAIEFNSTNNGTATINGPVDLSGFPAVVFNIDDGTADVDMVVNGVISNGGIQKQGPGTLSLQGANTYASGTDVQGGTLLGTTTSLQGTITSNAGTFVTFDQNFNGDFSGTLTLSGALNKTGSGHVRFNPPNVQTVGETTTVLQGTLIVNSTLTGAGALNVNPGAALAGTGTIDKTTTVNGTLSPGDNSIGTLTISGPTTLGPSSTLLIEITPTTNDLLDVTGGNSLSIQAGSTFEFVPQPGTYIDPLIYTVAQGTPVAGMFSNVNDPFPLFESQLTYPGNAVILQVFLVPVSSLPGLDANAQKVAHCLDNLNPPAGSDLYNVLNSLRFVSSIESIERALLTMQPSIFTALPVVKEASTLYFRNTLYDRMDVQSRSCRETERKIHVWFGPIFGITGEDTHGKEPGYDAFTPGAALGVDGFLLSNLQLGGSVAYTHSYVTWKEGRGDASVDAVYGSVFSRYGYNWLSVEGAIIAGYNHYSTTRNIHIGGEIPLRRNATATHHGFETSVHVRGSVFHPGKPSHIGPFVGIDFLYLYETSFDESGAKSLNLDVSSKHSNLLQTEIGVELARCYNLTNQTFNPYLSASFIWEQRFSNDRIDSRLDGCTLNVDGYSKSRALLGTAAGFIIEWNLKSAPKVSLGYKGKYGLGFADSSINLELIY